MTDLPKNTKKQDEAEDEFQSLIDWLPDWALKTREYAAAVTRDSRFVGPITRQLAIDALDLCSVLATALRRVHAEKEATGMLADLAADCQAAVEAAVVAERMACADYVLSEHRLAGKGRETINTLATIYASIMNRKYIE